MPALLAIVSVAIPALVHLFWRGSYMLEGLGAFWIGPISTTLPFVFLAILFLAHYFDLKSQSCKPAYCGLFLAWPCMMAFTTFIILQTPVPRMTSTMAIAVFLTPFLYIPLIVLPYFAGMLAGDFWAVCEEEKDREAPSVFRTNEEI